MTQLLLTLKHGWKQRQNIQAAGGQNGPPFWLSMQASR